MIEGLQPPPRPRFTRLYSTVSCDRCGCWQWLEGQNRLAAQAVALGWRLPNPDEAICLVCQVLAQPTPKPKAAADRTEVAWAQLVPWEVAKRQARWERDRRVRRAHLAGATYREIAAKLGKSSGRMHQLSEQARQREGKRSPVEKWLHDNRRDFTVLAGMVEG